MASLKPYRILEWRKTSFQHKKITPKTSHRTNTTKQNHRTHRPWKGRVYFRRRMSSGSTGAGSIPAPNCPQVDKRQHHDPPHPRRREVELSATWDAILVLSGFHQYSRRGGLTRKPADVTVAIGDDHKRSWASFLLDGRYVSLCRCLLRVIHSYVMLAFCFCFWYAFGPLVLDSSRVWVVFRIWIFIWMLECFRPRECLYALR